MRIYKMTATYGKLEHSTLTLEPGLNIIEAPNEWGKSTWCSFLVAMLYGLETRAKSTKTALADKERYAPWSGSPMAGRIDLSLNGRDITIERKTKGRIPLGQFSAYETGSGLPIPELTAANCGEMLLGVERSVFLRGGFIRFADLPVTQDETLRRRLNALVTTGDESGDGEKLQRGLRDLKNRVRYNRSGLLPQAEAERSSLEGRLRELESLEDQSGKLQQRAEEAKAWAARLENHKAHIRYQAARADEDRVAQAENACQEAARAVEAARQECEALPSREQAEQMLEKLRRLNQTAMDLRMEEQMAPQLPQEPEAPEMFRGMTGEEAITRAKEDGAAYEALHAKQPPLSILGALLLIVGCVLALWNRMVGILCAAVGIVPFAVNTMAQKRRRALLKTLEKRYGNTEPAEWLAQAELWAQALQDAELARRLYQASHSEREQRSRTLRQQIQEATGGQSLDQSRRHWEGVLAAWNRYVDVSRELSWTQNHLETLRSMAKTAEKPTQPDELTYSEPDTARLLSDAYAEQNQLQSRLGQYQGRMEALGDREAMRRGLEKLNARIAALEDTYGALVIAQQTLTEASLDLQRRFAPKISKRAQELMSAFTDGRYDRLTLGEELDLRAGAGEEDTLHDALWRSDGTVDQLYLALRLAVAEALTPHAPLVLDDALVRFDDTRLEAAMAVLKQTAERKQVILFTCQDREARYLAE